MAHPRGGTPGRAAHIVTMVAVTLLGAATADAAVLSNLQSGTLTISTASGTTAVTIDPIDTARSFLVFQTASNSNQAGSSTLRGAIASSTQLQFTRVSNASTAIDVSWYVLSFSSGVRVQRGTVNQAASTSTNVTLATPVSALSQAFVMWSKTPSAAETGWDANDPILGELTTPGNLQFRVATATTSHVIAWQVIEFTNAAEINVQKGSTSLPAAGSATVTLPTAVDVARTFVLVGFRTSGSGNDVGARMLRAQLTNSTTITIDRTIGGASDPITEIVWQAVELRDGSTVRSGTAAFANNQATATAPLTPAVDVASAVPLAAVQPVGGQNMGRSNLSSSTANAKIGVGTVTATLTPTLLTLTRSYAPAFTADVGWFVVEFRRRRVALVE